jgi:hypothetical protein
LYEYFWIINVSIRKKADGGLAKESVMELFGLNHKIGSTKSETLTDISEEDLKATFQERCKAFGKL